MQHGFGESEISWTTTGKANIILDNLIEMGKIKPFTLVMSDGMVQEKGVHEIRKIYPGGHDWNVWRPCFTDFAQMIFR